MHATVATLIHLSSSIVMLHFSPEHCALSHFLTFSVLYPQFNNTRNMLTIDMLTSRNVDINNTLFPVSPTKPSQETVLMFSRNRFQFL